MTTTAPTTLKTGQPLGRPLPKKHLAAILAGSALLLAAAVWLLSVLHPLPPRALSLACGPEGSADAMFGKRYQTLLAKQGIQLRLVTSTGGVENMALLGRTKGGVDLGFVNAGLAAETDDTSLVSLGTLCYEPLWLFTRRTAAARGLLSLRGKRVSVGPDGSDARAVLDAMAKRKAVDLQSFQLLPMQPTDAAAALLAGRIDAAILVNSYASPVVRQLIKTPGIQVASFERADAYVALFPSLTKRTLPAGVVNLEQDLPSHDITLLATKTSLIARGDLHPALQYLLLETLSQVHARSGIFQKAGEFPAGETQEIPLSAYARNYYKSGPPFLQRYLPFWLAALVEQWVLLLIPVLGLTYPLVKGLMALYGWGMQRRIFSIYGELHWLENQMDKLDGQPATPDIVHRMRQLEERTHRVRVSAKYVPMLYSLKETLAYVQARVDRQGRPESPSTAA